MQIFTHKLTKPDLVIFLILIIMTLIGVAVTNVAPKDAHGYWLIMTGVFAASAIFSGWRYTDDHKQKAKLVGLQILHWSSTLVAVLVVYAFLHTGQVSFETVSLMIVLVLALSSFLDGLQIGWHYSVLGVLLAVTAITISYVEEYVWVLLLVAVALLTLSLLFNYLRKSHAAD